MTAPDNQFCTTISAFTKSSFNCQLSSNGSHSQGLVSLQITTTSRGLSNVASIAYIQPSNSLIAIFQFMANSIFQPSSCSNLHRIIITAFRVYRYSVLYVPLPAMILLFRSLSRVLQREIRLAVL